MMPKALSAGKELNDKFRSEYSSPIKYVHLTLQFKYTYDLNAQQTTNHFNSSHIQA